MAVMGQASSARTVVLVEGVSDARALEALARRRGRDLAAERISILPIGGAKNIGAFLERFGPRGLGLRLAGLCDVAEAEEFRRGLERAGVAEGVGVGDMEALGFYSCVEDLEDELIRALGVVRVEEVLASQDELAAFRTFQKQPAQRDRTNEERLRRFLGTKSGRKERCAAVLVDALDLSRVPRPLELLLRRV